MSGPFKDRLVSALHESVGYFNQDNDPNAAVAKAAASNDFNIDQTRRLVEMFNTARTLYHYKSASDRTRDFALADVDDVLPRLFADTVKAASAQPPVYSYMAYDVRERSRHDPEAVEKAAAAPDTGSGLTLEAVARQAMTALRVQRQTAKIAADESRIASSAAARALTQAARMFATGVKEANEDRYARLVQGYRDQVEWAPVMAKLSEFMAEKDKAPEAVMRKYARCRVIDDRDLGPVLALLKEARDMMSTEAELLAAAGVLGKEADAFERDYLEALDPSFTCQRQDLLSGFIRPSMLKAAQVSSEQKYQTTDFFGEPVNVTAKSQPQGEGKPGLSDAIGGAVAGAVQKPLSSLLETQVERAFTGPMSRENKKLSDRLKNVQRQIMLQDLMTNDPVLSEESPDTVAEAYNAVLQMAPEVAGNKEVVRAVLRQTVHSVAVSPYDAEIWTKLEKNLQNLRGKPAGSGSKEPQ